MAHINAIAATPAQKVVVVNGSADVLGMLETVLDAGRYDMVFVESGNRAYSQIKKVQPQLVILCTRLDELDAQALQQRSQCVAAPDLCFADEGGGKIPQGLGEGVGQGEGLLGLINGWCFRRLYSSQKRNS